MRSSNSSTIRRISCNSRRLQPPRRSAILDCFRASTGFRCRRATRALVAMRWRQSCAFAKTRRCRRKSRHCGPTSMGYVKSSGSFRKRSRRSRGLRRRVIAAVILATCFTLAASLWSRDRSAHASARLPDVRTPADFVRELPALLAPSPGPVWNAADIRGADGQLRDAFAAATAGAQGWSLAVVDGNGNSVFDDRASSAVTPASVQKLVVAATALDVLGPAFRYHTVLASQAPAAT